jgi:hypothetical protein
MHEELKQLSGPVLCESKVKTNALGTTSGNPVNRHTLRHVIPYLLLQNHRPDLRRIV